MSGSGSSFSYNSPVQFLIEQAPPGNITPGDAPAISELYAFSQQVIYTFMSYCGIGPQNAAQYSGLAGSYTTILSGNLRRFYVQSEENILFGAMVSLTKVGSVLLVRNANAKDATRVADGFCSEANGIGIGEIGEIQLSTGVAQISGVVPGQRYWLGVSNGIISPAPQTATGNIEQYIGIGIDTSHVYVNISPNWFQH